MKTVIHTSIGAVLLLTMLSGCSTTPSQTASYSQPAKINASNPAAQQLLAHYREWQGTPYRYGGQSKQGIDCSGFIQLTYRDVFKQQVPRTTAMLSQTGTQVPAQSRQVGDLLLFKTGSKQRHAGIYVGNGQFIHASSSSGVMLSSLNNPYWAEAYRQTRRIE